jgi:DUF1365 family protein
VPYGFKTRIFMWHLDLSEIDSLCGKLRLLSHNRFNAYNFRDDDHLYLGETTLRDNIERYLQQEGVSETPARITLLTNLRTFGYVFNPVSFFFCYDDDDQPLAVVVEVHNTFGELKPFLLRKEDLSEHGYRREHPKLFYISPFTDLDQRLEIKVGMPDKRLNIQVNTYEKDAPQPFFRSALTGDATPLTNRALLGYSARFPLVTLKVISLIHWHALKLYLKKVPFHRKSDDPHLQRGIIPKKHQSLHKPTS